MGQGGRILDETGGTVYNVFPGGRPRGRSIGWEALHTDNLIFSLNATVPVFLLMVLGYLLHGKKWLLDTGFADKMNTFVFQLALPVQIFESLITADFREVWDGGAVLFCLVVTALSILIMMGLALTRKKPLRAEFIQAGYRSSQALLGAALMQNLYGHNGPLALIIIGSVPLYNAAAVLLLTLLSPTGGRLDRAAVGRALGGIARNPIILAIAAGAVWSVLEIPMPAMLGRAVASLGATATPLGLLALGASIDLKKAAALWRPTLTCSLFKLVLFAAMFLPAAIFLGYRGELLVAILVMLGSPTTVSSFTMARSMGHDGTLSAGAVMMTTVCSAFTFTLWLYLLRVLGFI